VGDGEVLSFQGFAGVDGDLVAAVAGDEQPGAAGLGVYWPAVVAAYSLAGTENTQRRRPDLSGAFGEQFAA